MPINHKIILPLLLSLAILLIPTHWIPLEGITVIEQRVVAIFVLAALCWILEPIPIFATSVLIIVLELLLLSDKGIWFMTADKAEPPVRRRCTVGLEIGDLGDPVDVIFRVQLAGDGTGDLELRPVQVIPDPLFHAHVQGPA